jgi:hypothetical protein
VLSECLEQRVLGAAPESASRGAQLSLTLVLCSGRTSLIGSPYNAGKTAEEGRG